jgi:glycosyltransferase involved in cell wall biosynthesis
MNILLVTDLYPAHSKEERGNRTFAIHDIFKNMKKEANILVIRPMGRPILFNRRDNYFTEPYFKIDDIKVYNLNYIRIPKINLAFNYKNKILKILKKENFIPDIIIGHDFKSLPIIYNLSEKLNKPYIIGCHLGNIKALKNKIYRKLNKKFYIKAAKIAYRSFYIKKELEKVFNFDNDKLFFIPSGITMEPLDLKLIEKKFDSFRKDKINITIVSRLVKRKHIDKVLLALGKVKGNFICNIIGDGPEYDNLINLVNKNLLKEKVKFWGYQNHEKIKKILEKSHIFILISEWETFGLVYIEAMSQGNVVIGSLNEGIDGIIINDYNGFLINAGSVNELELLLDKIFTNLPLEKIKQIAINAREESKKYSNMNIAKNYLCQIKKVLKK